MKTPEERRQHYAENRDAIDAVRRAWYHRPEVKARIAEQRKKQRLDEAYKLKDNTRRNRYRDPGKKREYQKRYAQRHKEEIQRREREKYAADPVYRAKVLARNARCRERKRALGLAELIAQMEDYVLAALRRSPNPATLDDIKSHLETGCPDTTDTALTMTLGSLGEQGIVTIHQDSHHYSLRQNPMQRN